MRFFAVERGSGAVVQNQRRVVPGSIGRNDILFEDWADRRVKCGAALLDRRLKRDWRVAIDVAVLNMSNSIDCILGQLYGHFMVGVLSLGINDSSEIENLGFMTPRAADRLRLAHAWSREILFKRQSL